MVPARVVFSAVAVPHAVAIAAGWRGLPRVRFDRAVEHLLAPHRPSAARPEGPLRHGERRHGMDDPPRLGSWPTPTRSPVIMALTTAENL